MSNSIEITPELMAGFLDEATEHIGLMTTHLLCFEQAAEAGPLTFEDPANQHRMTELFRSAHSLKGLSAAFGFAEINRLTHTLETLCDEARNGKRSLDTTSLNVLLKSVARVEMLVGAIQAPTQQAPDIADVLAELEAVLKSPATTSVDVPQPAAAMVACESPAAASAEDVAAAVTPEAIPEIIPELAMVPESVLHDPELRKCFIESAEEITTDLSKKLLELEQGVSDGLLNDVFRLAHSLKGACGAACLHDATELTHRMENLFERLRAGHAALTERDMAALLTVSDRLSEVIEQVKSDSYVAWPDERVASVFDRADAPSELDMSEVPAPSTTDSEPAAPVDLTAEFGATDAADESTRSAPGESIVAPPAAASDAAPMPAAPVVRNPRFRAPMDALKAAGQGCQARVTFAPTCPEREFQAYLILNKVKSLGDVIWMAPDLDTVGLGDAADVEFVIQISDAEPISAAELRSILGSFVVESVDVVSIDRLAVADAGIAGGGPASETVAMASSAAHESGTPAIAARDATPARPSASPAPTKAPARSPQAPAATGSAATSAPPPASTSAAPARHAPAGAATIRVDVDRLDQLMNLGGELVINRARFAQAARELRGVFDGRDPAYLAEDVGGQLDVLGVELRKLGERVPEAVGIADRLGLILQEFNTLRQHAGRVRDAKPSMHHLAEAVNTLERISDSLQKRIMDTRMVPIGPLFQRFQRLARDLSKDLGKKIQLVMLGESTELDKKMIDELADPLTHMIRNSADHGIETPEGRAAAGKPATATITLAAFHQGNHICIEVRDDGRGIDLQRVKEKLVERQIASEAQVAQMSPHELVQYIFHPGFSTAKQVSDLSGRGMGMDIVKTKIAGLNGTVEVATEAGAGTCVTVRLPLTLAIIRALQTGIGSEVYAIPLESVCEIVTFKRSAIRSVQGTHVARVRDSVIPVVVLEDLLDVREAALRTVSRTSEEWTIVILKAGAGRIGIVVDRLIGQEDVVIKSLAENYRHVRGFSGATIMGDGRISLILDVAQVVNSRSTVLDSPAGERDSGCSAARG